MLMERYDEHGETPSYYELADADNLISDEEVYEEYGGTMFVPEDFGFEEEEDDKEEYQFGADISGTPEYIAEQLRLIASDIENGYYSGFAGGYGASWGLDRI